MAIDKIFKSTNLDDVADNILSEVDDFVFSVDKMQQRKVAGNVQKVVQAFRQIETELQKRYDNVTDVLEKRISTINDGRDGLNGTDGRSGRDGKPGRDGVNGKQGPPGTPGKDGIDGVNGVSVTNANIDFDGSLVISLSTGEQINVGEVVPPELERQLVELRQGGSAGSSGDVMGPTSSTDNAIARFDGTTGKLVQNSLVTIDDTGNTSIPAKLTIGSTTANTKLNVNTTTYTAVTNGEQVLIEGSSAWQQGLAFSMWSAGLYNSNYASGYIGVPNSSNQLYISGGAAVVDNTGSGGWAKALNTTSASFMVVGGGSTTFYGNTGLTANTTFSPSVLMSLTTTGLAVTGTLSATGTLSGGTSGTAYSFSGSAPATSLTLNSSGNLGIDTTSVDSKLEINSNSSNTARIRIKLNDTPFCYFGGYSGIAGSGNADDLALYAWTGKQLMFGTNASEKMRIDTSGIVTMNAYGAGAATFSSAGVISSVSDETWKVKDGVPTDPDAMLKKLEPGYWYYNDEKKETFGADRQLGFYAQNVNAAIGPEAAPTPQEGKPWGYYDRSVLAVTVMSLQKALATIETLTARITALETA